MREREYSRGTPTDRGDGPRCILLRALRFYVAAAADVLGARRSSCTTDYRTTDLTARQSPEKIV